MANQEEKRRRLGCALRGLADGKFVRVATEKEVRNGEGASAPAGAGRSACTIPT